LPARRIGMDRPVSPIETSKLYRAGRTDTAEAWQGIASYTNATELVE
jgi:hypothetical protein